MDRLVFHNAGIQVPEKMSVYMYMFLHVLTFLRGLLLCGICVLNCLKMIEICCWCGLETNKLIELENSTWNIINMIHFPNIIPGHRH